MERRKQKKKCRTTAGHTFSHRENNRPIGFGKNKNKYTIAGFFREPEMTYQITTNSERTDEQGQEELAAHF